MEGAAVVLIALLLYPLYLWLKKRFSNQIVAHAISFVANAFTCTVIEFIGGILFNAQHQNWDYSDMPFNFMGQVCLQNALAFGVAASLIAWYAYPALERAIARVRPGIMSIVFVVVIAIGGILFSLYAIAPPEGMDLGAVKQELADMGETLQQSGGVLSTIELADSFTSTTQDVLTDATSVDEATRNEAQEHLSKAREELAKAKELLQDVA
jgi:predicted PurR-regulated permease PerM